MYNRNILFEIKCSICSKHFVYCVKSLNDFRCYNCKKGFSVEAVEKELEEMSKEEYESFMEEIREYEHSIKKV